MSGRVPKLAYISDPTADWYSSKHTTLDSGSVVLTFRVDNRRVLGSRGVGLGRASCMPWRLSNLSIYFP